MNNKKNKQYALPPWLATKLERKHVLLNAGGLKTKLRALVNYSNYMKLKKEEEKNNG